MWRLAGALGASALGASALAAAAAAPPPGASGRAATPPSGRATYAGEWAYPNPYEAGQPAGRFLSGEFRKSCWDLEKLYRTWVAEWERGTDGETWPWVWVWHNKNGPHHVFYGVDDTTLALARAMARASPRNNGLLIVDSIERDITQKGYSEADFHGQRCGIIESAPAQIDPRAKVLMTQDERIIAYDALNIAR